MFRPYASHQLLDVLGDDQLVRESYQLLADITVLYEEQRRQLSYVVLLGQRRIRSDVTFRDDRVLALLLGYLVKSGFGTLAVGAGGRIEFNHQRLFGGKNVVIILVCEFSQYCVTLL